MTSPLGTPQCWAGRWAFFGGRWNNIPPCNAFARHIVMADEGGRGLTLCDEHFQQVYAAGLILYPDSRYRPPS